MVSSFDDSAIWFLGSSTFNTRGYRDLLFDCSFVTEGQARQGNLRRINGAGTLSRIYSDIWLSWEHGFRNDLARCPINLFSSNKAAVVACRSGFWLGCIGKSSSAGTNIDDVLLSHRREKEILLLFRCDARFCALLFAVSRSRSAGDLERGVCLQEHLRQLGLVVVGDSYVYRSADLSTLALRCAGRTCEVRTNPQTADCISKLCRPHLAQSAPAETKSLSSMRNNYIPGIIFLFWLWHSVFSVARSIRDCSQFTLSYYLLFDHRRLLDVRLSMP